MSMHKIPLTAGEEEGLRKHGLDIGTPSQLSDVFRLGMKWQAARQPAPAEQVPVAWLYEKDGSEPVVSTLRQLMPSGSGWKETRLYTAPQRVAELEALLFEIGQGCSKREMPSEQTLNEWFDRIDAALAKHGEASHD